VKAGDVIALLDDQQMRARVEQAQAALAQSEAHLESGRRQITVLEDQIHQITAETGHPRWTPRAV